MNALFRREVRAGRQQLAMGEVVLAAPPGRGAWTTLAASLAACALLLVAFGDYTAHARVSGQLGPVSGTTVLAAAGDGVVGAMRVREGDAVGAGQLLVELQQDRGSLAFEATSARIGTQIAARTAELETSLQQQERLGALERAGMEARMRILDAQMATIGEQLQLQEQAVAGARQMLARVAPLAEKGIISRVQLHQQYEREAAETSAQLLTLRRQRLDLDRERTDLHHQIMQLPDRNAASRSGVRLQLAENAQQSAQNELSRASGLRAPRDGIVAIVLAEPGQTVRAGQPLLSILPLDARMEALLLVPSASVGLIKVGATAFLRYPAYPYQKYGLQHGVVRDVSRSALTRGEIESLTGHSAATDEPLYRVRVELPRQALDTAGEPLRLLPGMTVDADIVLERRSLLEWALGPLMRVRRHAGTETAPS